MINYFPFSAIVGLEKLKIAYLVNIVNPKIGGLLISGPKGSGKSTVVHSIKQILPEYKAIEGCPFNCNPEKKEMRCSLCQERTEFTTNIKKMTIVNLPLSCTEDRLIGSVNIEKLMKEGKKEIQTGLLGQANRNILYIDEINLLPDHLVDDILDAASSHWNTIEREGISIRHPSEFVLVGTMNSEEGELRPQILDRLPLCVKVKSPQEPELRVEIIKRNLIFEKNPKEFYKYFEKQDNRLKNLIKYSKDHLNDVVISDNFLNSIAKSCAELKVDGHRPDIIIVKTSKTIACMNQRKSVNIEDILLSAELTLSHRTRDGGLLEPLSLEDINLVFKKNLINETSKSAKPDFNANDLNQINMKNDKFNNKIEKLSINKGETSEKKV